MCSVTIKKIKTTNIYKLMIKTYSPSVFFALFLTFLTLSCGNSGKERTWFVNMETTEGDIKLKLYNNTPLHRDNFIKLVKDNYYDGIRFHRVIEDFMIQAGDYRTNPDIAADTTGTYEYTIPAEIHEGNFHKRGALAAARTGDRFNPERASSGTQFYIVQGRKYNGTLTESGDTISAEQMISDIENRINSSMKQNIFYINLQEEKEKSQSSGDGRTDAEIQEAATLKTYDELENFTELSISPEHIEVYKTEGGTPHLDMQYTVFGEVVEGFDVIDRIAAVETDAGDKPLNEVIIKKARMARK